MKTLSDLTTPATPKRKLLERDIQKQCVDWARGAGFWARKFSSMTQNSVPDYLFARTGWPMFAVEFKAPGKTSTAAQLDEQEAMRAAGWYVFQVDNFAQFKRMVQCLEGRPQENTQ